ncbi:DUF4148 domain-containing protein [Paraburkholderia largidicola]|uniref:DUF4148 domain-containing protein n=1 Tax=Paraburkholderia largidicola TaxID=3014751 RepID=A0A7I8BU88_9BURK|nr:DUF4148 domain-containing protein [Paraburkholderia sp. PGU16]BCF92192.1 hypothetical protein PPGU16_52590 [Paraburkholderia sp. PGU16]
MKLPTLFAVTVLGLAFGANAFAQTPSHSVTRAEVHAQLVEAQADGLLPVPKNDYPPSADTIARNKELYAIQHHHSASDTASSTGNVTARSAASD